MGIFHSLLSRCPVQASNSISLLNWREDFRGLGVKNACYYLPLVGFSTEFLRVSPLISCVSR